MQQYQKINTSYKRYQNITKDNCPNPKWMKWRNQIILGSFSDKSIEFLKDCPFEGYEKIDGTCSKIVFFPYTGEVLVGGKTDNAESQHGQFEMLQAIADRIKPKLCELFPKEIAKFAPVKNKETNKVQYYIEANDSSMIEPKAGFCGIQLEEIPIYIYGEYYGKGIQKCGPRYSDNNDFVVFDINMQGWWLPKELRDNYCKELSLKQVPFLGVHTFSEFEKMVIDGFTTTMADAKDPSLMAEGVVARPVIPLKNENGSRIIVKIKSCDYNSYNQVRKEFTNDEFNEFNKWYSENIEPGIK